MTHEVKDFASYAKAERQLCDAAAPLLATIVGAIKTDTAVVVTEIRATFVHDHSPGAGVSTNCTIVHAHLPARQVGVGSHPNAGVGVADRLDPRRGGSAVD
jgi:hypothetical protein